MASRPTARANPNWRTIFLHPVHWALLSAANEVILVCLNLILMNERPIDLLRAWPVLNIGLCIVLSKMFQQQIQSTTLSRFSIEQTNVFFILRFIL